MYRWRKWTYNLVFKRRRHNLWSTLSISQQSRIWICWNSWTDPSIFHTHKYIEWIIWYQYRNSQLGKSYSSGVSTFIAVCKNRQSNNDCQRKVSNASENISRYLPKGQFRIYCIFSWHFNIYLKQNQSRKISI